METDDAFRLHLNVPGMSAEDITTGLQNRTLTVSGERSSGRTDGSEDFVRADRAFGTFHRTFTLPDAVDADNIEATYDDGVLTTTAPKTDESTRRQIEIQ